MVADLDVAEPQVLALSATLPDGSDKPIGYRVYADPVGHPFCLVTPRKQPKASDPTCGTPHVTARRGPQL